MDQSIWSRFKCFVQESVTAKLKAFMPGVFMGFIGGQHLLFSGYTLSLVGYILKFAGTVTMAFFSGLATSYAAYLVEIHKNKKNVTTQKRRKKGDRAA